MNLRLSRTFKRLHCFYKITPSCLKEGISLQLIGSLVCETIIETLIKSGFALKNQQTSQLQGSKSGSAWPIKSANGRTFCDDCEKIANQKSILKNNICHGKFQNYPWCIIQI